MVDEMKWFWSSFLHGSWKTGPHQMTYYGHVLYSGKQSTITDEEYESLGIQIYLHGHGPQIHLVNLTLLVLTQKVHIPAVFLSALQDTHLHNLSSVFGIFTRYFVIPSPAERKRSSGMSSDDDKITIYIG
jgi:hypothetical protein